MKKILAFMLVFAMVFTMTACGECKHRKTETKNAVAATCTASGLTEGEVCADCGETLVAQETIEALGHDKSGESCSRCGTSFSVWSVSYYVDEFDQPTSEGYVYNPVYFSGKFSNSATTDSLLTSNILVDADDIAIFLYEYGKNTVKNNSSNYVDDYDITMKLADGTKKEMTGTIYCGGDRLVVDDSYKSAVLSALKSGENVSFYIVDSDYPTTNYLLTVQTTGFASTYEKLFG